LFFRGRADLEKAYRIKKNTEIEAIIKQKSSVGNNHFVVYQAENPQNDHFRFAISVSKKYGTAVERNKVKRRIREIVRLLKLSSRNDFLVVVKPAAIMLDFISIRDELTKLFARAKIIKG